MTALNNLTPQGCAGPATGVDFAGRGDYPEFPCDFLPRIRKLDLGIENIFLAWEIARLAGRETEAGLHRALVLLLLTVQLVSAEGSTRLQLTSGSQLDRILNDFEAVSQERAAIKKLIDDARRAAQGSGDSKLAALFGGPGDYRPLIIDHDCLYIQKLYELEARVGKMLGERIADKAAAAAGKAIESALADVFANPPVKTYGKIELDNEQKNAVLAALSGKITIVSGRPGSGKTSIVASLLRVLARIGSPPLESIALTAPTGKAAERMRQAVANHLATILVPGEADRRLFEACPPASTIHRLLNYSPGRDRFWHNENNPLSEQLIIVDESSMVDLAMMDRLLRALRPEARVVFLGDADQLPSIETGAVFRDLCLSDRANKSKQVVELKQSYRAREEDLSGRQILDAAAAVNAGLSPVSLEEGRMTQVRKHAAELTFNGVEHLIPGDVKELDAFYTKWHELISTSLPDLDDRLSRIYYSEPGGFDQDATEALQVISNHYERFKILCVTRVVTGGTESEAVNNWFHRRWSEDQQIDTGGEKRLFNFLVGEPVIVTRNDYNLRLYNGDSGLVLRVAPATIGAKSDPEPMAVFRRGNGFTAFPPEALRGKLEPAWATTVHKAQGSEYEVVAILLPGVHVRPLTRELLYTAVTRAKRSVVIVGSTEVLEAGVKRRMERASGLAEMIG